MSSVKVSSYKAELRGYKTCDVLDNVWGVWLSVAVEYCHSIYYDPQHVWVIEALSSLVS